MNTVPSKLTVKETDELQRSVAKDLAMSSEDRAKASAKLLATLQGDDDDSDDRADGEHSEGC